MKFIQKVYITKILTLGCITTIITDTWQKRCTANIATTNRLIGFFQASCHAERSLFIIFGMKDAVHYNTASCQKNKPLIQVNATAYFETHRYIGQQKHKQNQSSYQNTTYCHFCNFLRSCLGVVHIHLPPFFQTSMFNLSNL